MSFIQKTAQIYQRFFACLSKIDFLAPLAFRLYLVPIFWIAGTQKFLYFQDTVAWFGNAEWGLGLPFPFFMALLVATVETAGAIFLATGFAVRLISLPLIVVMLVAIFSVHIDNGWLAISAADSEAHIRFTGFLEWLNANHPKRHDFITELGEPVMLNNGIEFAMTYSLMLLSLVFTGAGRYVSLDYWLKKRLK